MGAFGDIIKKLHEAANMEVGEEKTTRVRITIANGNPKKTDDYFDGIQGKG